MYLVVSKWEFIPGQQDIVETEGRNMREFLRNQPGIELVEAIRVDGGILAVHGYRDEAAYKALIQDENGPFQQKLRESGLENHMRWAWSERGESVDSMARTG
jgi:hypothetical protein